MRKPPPKKKHGAQRGPRRIDGDALDITGGAGVLGITEKATRARVARNLLPYRRLNGRIIFIRGELLAFLEALPGVTVEQALANVATRDGREPDA